MGKISTIDNILTPKLRNEKVGKKKQNV